MIRDGVGMLEDRYSFDSGTCMDSQFQSMGLHLQTTAQTNHLGDRYSLRDHMLTIGHNTALAKEFAFEVLYSLFPLPLNRRRGTSVIGCHQRASRITEPDPAITCRRAWLPH